jgi:hypothetical protein
LLTFRVGLLALFPLGRAALILRSTWSIAALRTAFLARGILRRGNNKARQQCGRARHKSILYSHRLSFLGSFLAQSKGNPKDEDRFRFCESGHRGRKQGSLTL